MRKLYSILLLFLCLFVNQVFGQNDISITGKVVDGDGQPINAVSIRALPSNKTLGLSNAQGAYTVKVPSNTKSLLFTAVGFSQKTISIGDKTVVNVELASNNQEIEEVTVAYTVRKKETLTGSAVVISGKDIKDAPAANFTDLLQGRVAGFNVQLNNGTPGMRGSMSIRGLNTTNVSASGGDAFLGRTSPLFVVDGVPIEEGSNFEYGFQSQGPGISPISMIPPDEIESITVLKDAQATSQYGSKGAYGVILVTTKRGNSSIPVIRYSSKYFMSLVPKLKRVIGGSDENRLRVNQILQYDTTYAGALRLINDSPFLSDTLNPYYNNSTDWHSYFYANRFNMNHSLSIDGGNERFNYKVAPSYYDQKGIIRNTAFRRYNVQSNMRYKPTDRFLISAYLNASMAKNSTGSGNAFQQSGVANSVNTSSLLPSPSIYTGSFDALSATSTSNDNKSAGLVTNIDLEYEIFKGFRASTTFKYQYDLATQDRFVPEILNSGQNKLYTYDDNNKSIYSRNQIRYNGNLFDDERQIIQASVFSEASISSYRAQAMQMMGSGSDQIQVGSGFNARSTKGGYLNNLSDRKSLGYLGSVSYQFDSRYIVDIAYRLDGTSTSGAESPWAHNPTAGVRWNFNKESWFKNSVFSDGSVRVTWGRNIYPTGSIYDVYGRYFVESGSYNNQQIVSLDMDKIPNIAMTPIVNSQWNYAIDLGFLDQRLTLTYEHYYKETKDELADIQLANISSFNKITKNEKGLVNIGHEVSFSFRPQVKSADWSFNTYGNLSYNKDYLSKLPNGIRQEIFQPGDDSYIMMLNRLGRNSFSNVLYHYKGVYQSDNDVPVNPVTGLKYRATNNKGEEYFFRAGDPIFTDLNGDYVLDREDLVVVGNAIPRLSGGFGATIRYKNWGLQPNFTFTLKRDVINRAKADVFRNYYNPTEQKALMPLDFDYWQQNNLDASYPSPLFFRRANAIDPYRYNSTLFQEDGSYLKLGSTTLSYNVNREWSSKYGISSLRFYLNANNIYTWSKYSGPDPEMVTDLGYDNSNGYPRSREFTFGLDIQF
ncbi:SusC/RagA family TonB-linked outer membrane protein [Sphingobacterium bovistauri]|uniref:SusC/RagA family TonB-linked outer membrane protein n=1 Tax=Sphingobacterium bovistauri TaxID=2781959 RepID=A0ABS7Z6X9_9SPHI|nr:SusC/RagA family TonB-linked outer membrane protein [Sphingobacterium bovistauri]MCA5005914.1 SusC/RagA family TonB-linked outer membrane protein [Sphingobacterium bovistauri]